MAAGERPMPASADAGRDQQNQGRARRPAPQCPASRRRGRRAQGAAQSRACSRSPFPAPAGARRQGRTRHPCPRALPASAPAPGPPRRTGQLGRALGDLEFRQVGAARQFLDLAAVLVARLEIERRIVAALAQQLVDAADSFEPLRPFDVVDEPQAANDVAGRHVAAGQRVMLAQRDLLGVGAGLLKLLLQPDQRLAGILRTVAQAIEQAGWRTWCRAHAPHSAT